MIPSHYQWKESTDCWKAELSTKGLTGSAPRYWKVEWSVDDSQWSQAGSYTVPDVTQWDNTCYWQLCGYKHVNCELPVDVLGKEKLYIRLIPAHDKAGQTKSYDGGTKANGKWSSVAYFAVRYTPN